jgi:hypothetical protein
MSWLPKALSMESRSCQSWEDDGQVVSDSPRRRFDGRARSRYAHHSCRPVLANESRNSCQFHGSACPTPKRPSLALEDVLGVWVTSSRTGRSIFPRPKHSTAVLSVLLWHRHPTKSRPVPHARNEPLSKPRPVRRTSRAPSTNHDRYGCTVCLSHVPCD